MRRASARDMMARLRTPAGAAQSFIHLKSNMTSRPSKSSKNKIGITKTGLSRDEAAAFVGKRARVWFLDKIAFDVRVLDYERQYGNHRWLVEPLSGVGRSWLANVEIISDAGNVSQSPQELRENKT